MDHTSSSEHTTTGANFEGKINQPTLWTQPWTNLFCLDLGGARPCESITQLQSGATRKVSSVWIGVLSHLSTQLAQKKMRPADRQACIEMVNVAQREQHGDRTTSWQWTKSRLHPLSLELFLLDDNFGRFEVGAILFYACADKSHLCFVVVQCIQKFFSQTLFDFKKSISGAIELKFSGKTLYAILLPPISSLVGLFLK